MSKLWPASGRSVSYQARRTDGYLQEVPHEKSLQSTEDQEGSVSRERLEIHQLEARECLVTCKVCEQYVLEKSPMPDVCRKCFGDGIQATATDKLFTDNSLPLWSLASKAQQGKRLPAKGRAE